MRFLIAFFAIVSALAINENWRPPVGIPMPPFGITNSHWMYTNAGKVWNYGAGNVPYRQSTNGPYTRYVDNTVAGASDGTNTWGTPTHPRLTVPQILSAGEVVELHGGPYNFSNGGSRMSLGGNGTESDPIFIRGGNAIDRGYFSGRDLRPYGSNVVIEFLIVSNEFTFDIRPDAILPGVLTNICFRYNEVAGDGSTSTETAFGVGVPLNGVGFYNLVFFSNIVHDLGDWQGPTENDSLAFGVGGRGHTNVWILDNVSYHMGGDSIRAGDNNSSLTNYGQGVYVGRNLCYDNRENGIDIKWGVDMVFSENFVHGITNDPASSSGEAIVLHYGPTNVWIINNVVSNSLRGITPTLSGNTLYVIGNRVEDCVHGILPYGGDTATLIAGNTINNCLNGVTDEGQSDSGGRHVIGNIISNPKEGGYHLYYASSARALNSSNSHNLFWQSGGGVNIRWGATTYTSLAAYQSATSKGQNCLNVDPLFGTGLQLSGSSPGVNVSTNLTAYVALHAEQFPTAETIGKDLLGISRPRQGVWDIGAFEYVVTTFTGGMRGSASVAGKVRVQ